MLKYVPQLIKEYGLVGNDMRAVQDFMECESAEAIASLRGELASISQGSHPMEFLDKSLGISRKVKYGSHEQWARNVLLWMAAKKA